MPEIISRYPEVVLQVLKGSGAKCGMGAKQAILTSCPPNKFCALPTGEICVYGVHDISNMTQITVADLSEITSGIPTIYGVTNLFLLMIVFVLGVGVGMWWYRK